MQPLRELVQSFIDAGCTQTEIAEKTGVKQATISRILSGKHADPRSSTADKLRQFKVRPPRRRAVSVPDTHAFEGLDTQPEPAAA